MRVVVVRVALVAVCELLSACGEPAVYRPSQPDARATSGSGDEDEAAGEFAKIQRPVVSSGGQITSNITNEQEEESFPEVKFNLKNAPDKKYELNVLPLEIEADTTITNFAYKLATVDSCADAADYRTQKMRQDVSLDLTEVPQGPVYLCLLAFYGPTKRWESPVNARVYSWQKVPLKRTFLTTMQVMDNDNCSRPTMVRLNATVSIEGKYGISTWRRESHPDCREQTQATVDGLFGIKANPTEITGYFQRSGQLSGWFRWTFADATASKFTGNWGLGELDSSTQGTWSTR